MTSSESENEKLLHSAIDHDFINDIFTRAASSSETSLPSLRPKEKNNGTYELKVTPGFQKHVAKHLDAIIQKNLKEVSNKSVASRATTKEVVGGIRLFSHSKSFITKRDLESGFHKQLPSHKRRRKSKITKRSESESGDDESSVERQRLSSAAVSPEWVLQKMGAYGMCEKGKVIRLKDCGNGQLIEVEPSECLL
ncbi:protein CUSTOS-like [Hetaerina americana]|uniref:protein CUSTOS-like n=1 Tax=Hetaerina americana TaxID=62018 RepID=UPI003A7F5619